MRFEGGDPCASRDVIHAIRGRRSTRSEGVGRVTCTEKEGDPHALRVAIHALQGRSSTRSDGGDARAPREVVRIR
jgi:hypothetical protein